MKKLPCAHKDHSQREAKKAATAVSTTESSHISDPGMQHLDSSKHMKPPIPQLTAAAVVPQEDVLRKRRNRPGKT